MIIDVVHLSLERKRKGTEGSTVKNQLQHSNGTSANECKHLAKARQECEEHCENRSAKKSRNLNQY